MATNGKRKEKKNVEIGMKFHGGFENILMLDLMGNIAGNSQVMKKGHLRIIKPLEIQMETGKDRGALLLVAVGIIVESRNVLAQENKHVTLLKN